MFDGISLTEHQRQQMRDLMQRARQDQPLLMLAKWRQCIALSPQKILTKALCALRQKKWHRTGCPPGRDGEGPQPDVPPANARAASGFERETSATNGSVA
jgi:hypothetical protein